VALLKTLGFTRGQVLRTFAVEHLFVGATAGAIGAVAGTLLAWAVIRHVLDLPWVWSLGGPLAAAAATTAVTLVTSLLATRGALRTRPAATLQSVG
jgi:putative ABC transport system permease protein